LHLHLQDDDRGRARGSAALRAGLAILTGLLLFALAACGGNNNGGGAGKTSASGTSQDPTSDAAMHKPLNCTTSPTAQDLLNYKAPKAKKQYDITVMEVSLNGYYYQLLAYGAEQAAKDAGVNVHITAASGYTTPAVQRGQADDVIQRGTDGVVFAPVDIQGSVPAVNEFKAKKIPVVNVSTEVASPYVYTIMQDDYLMGKDMADRIHRLAPQGGQGILMAGPANATWSRKRVAGFNDQVDAKYSDMDIVAAPTSLVDPGEALKKFANSVAAHPDIKWIASVDYSLPVPQAIPDQFKQLPYVTMGFDPNVKQAVTGGLVDATLPTDGYHMGYVGVGTVVGLLNGDKAPKFNCVPFTPAITKSNVSSPFTNQQLYPPGFKAKTG
jgi:ribose transport system substrate-binding protein